MRCSCCATIWVNGKPRVLGPAVARWIGQNRVPILLCQWCLDIWLDNADDDDDLEPINVVWLATEQRRVPVPVGH